LTVLLQAGMISFMADLLHAFVSPQGRGIVTLPVELRRRMHLDEPGAQVELTERADGVVELRAVLPVPADERWFWDERWQVGERAVDAHVAAGRTTNFESDEDLLAGLDDS
jgi:bifunctional DNA-binding transcriptional regulator/antitoxin component of YhaV-PrlF toxin-antitoxin module